MRRPWSRSTRKRPSLSTYSCVQTHIVSTACSVSIENPPGLTYQEGALLIVIIIIITLPLPPQPPVGSTESLSQPMWVLDEESKNIVQRNITYVSSNSSSTTTSTCRMSTTGRGLMICWYRCLVCTRFSMRSSSMPRITSSETPTWTPSASRSTKYVDD